MIRVRLAVSADCDAIGHIHVAAWSETYRGMIPDSIIERVEAHARSTSALTASPP